MPRALEQATSSSSDILPRWNWRSGNGTGSLVTWRSQEGASPFAGADAEGAEGPEGLAALPGALGGLWVRPFLAEGSLGVVRDGLRCPASGRAAGLALAAALPTALPCDLPAFFVT